jgi:cytokinin dehydrogenase
VAASGLPEQPPKLKNRRSRPSGHAGRMGADPEGGGRVVTPPLEVTPATPGDHHTAFEGMMQEPGRHLITSDEVLEQAASDFGHQTYKRPKAVARPRTVADLRELVHLAAAASLSLRPRGGGHSLDGQSTIDGGILIDMSAMNHVEQVSTTTVRAQAGATWRQVLSRTLPLGLAPPVVVDYLDLTVGGTLSVGGISGATHRHGWAVDNVRRARVITYNGDLEDVGDNDPLLTEVLGGQGDHGIIADATFDLVPAPKRVTTRRMIFRDADALLSTQAHLVNLEACVHVDGRLHLEGGSWVYTVDATVASTDLALDDLLLPVPPLASYTTSMSTQQFFSRADAGVQALKERGAWWGAPHPRRSFLFPYGSAHEVIPLVLEEIDSDLGPGGFVNLYALDGDRARSPFVLAPSGDLVVLLGVQRTVPTADNAALSRMQESNDVLDALIRRAGGVVYPVTRA